VMSKMVCVVDIRDTLILRIQWRGGLGVGDKQKSSRYSCARGGGFGASLTLEGFEFV
jgi:hypothetical protein